MVKRTGPTNIHLRKLISLFRKLRKWKKLFGKLAEELNKPRRQKKGVNLWKIEKYANEGEVVVVPDKLLSYGNLTKKVVIFAYDFSKACIEKLNKLGIEYHKLKELPDYLKKLESEGKKVMIRIIK